MQLYRGMDIGTAKLPPSERRGVPHHLLDVWDVTETGERRGVPAAGPRRRSTSCGRAGVRRCSSAARASTSGRSLDDLEFPGTDADVRARLEAELGGRGPRALHARLAALDPAAAAAILPSNGRRIVRALEVVELTGGPFTREPARRRAPSTRRCRSASTSPRPDLDARIDVRVERMWERRTRRRGARALERSGCATGVTASRALGYAQVLRLLDGELTEAEAIEQTPARAPGASPAASTPGSPATAA